MKTNFLDSTKPDTWPNQRVEILCAMQTVMGELPPTQFSDAPAMRVLSEEKTSDFTRQKIEIQISESENDWLPTYLLLPHEREGAVPGVLCLHQTTGIGKAEPAGVGGNPNLHYAAHLASRGFVTLAPDYPNFGDSVFDAYENGFVSTTMKGIVNHRRAIDFLQSLPEVDGQRIGCIGHSLGGHNSIFVAAFDERIKATISCCGFCTFAKYMKGDLTGWSHAGYMPRIANHYDCDPQKMPFDFPEVIAAIAPRAFLAVSPTRDSNFDVSGARDCLDAAQPIYEMLGAAEKLAGIFPDCEHDFPEDARNLAYDWLGAQLA
jgi:dienelactone hydrolase